MTSQHEATHYEDPRVYSLKIDKNSIKIKCPPGRQFSCCRRHLAWLFSALQLILSKCKLRKNVPNGFRARLNFGLVEDLNEFYRNVRGIIGKHSETIVISFQPVTFIIIIPLFRHANFWLPLTIAAVEKPHNIQQVFSCFDVLSSLLLGVRCLICSVETGNAWVVRMPFRGGPVRANLLVRVDCQAYQPTHFTIWLYSYCRSGTLTVSAHQNTTLTPTTFNDRSLHYKPLQVIKKKKKKSMSYSPHNSNSVTFRKRRWDGSLAQSLTSTTVLTCFCFYAGIWSNCVHFDVLVQWISLNREGKPPAGCLRFVWQCIDSALTSNIWEKRLQGPVRFTVDVWWVTCVMATTIVSTKDSDFVIKWFRQTMNFTMLIFFLFCTEKYSDSYLADDLQTSWFEKPHIASDLEPRDAFDQAYDAWYHNKSGWHDWLSLNNGASWPFHKSLIGRWPQSPALHKSISTKLELQKTHNIANMSDMFASIKEIEWRSNRQGSHIH